MPYQLLADLVLVLHVVVVLFVIGGLMLLIVGNTWWRWRWVNAPSFRLAHLAAIGIVVVEAWVGATCPLTTLEMALRLRAGTSVYGGSFIQYWLQRLLYYEAPAWVFALAYSLFGLIVVLAWWYFPPTFRRRSRGGL